MNNKIIFGTVKFGVSDYGFSSNEAQLSSNEMLFMAEKLGIEILDTSPRYGNAEKLIGNYHLRNDKRFRICTKVDNLIPNDSSTENKIYNSVRSSIKQTNIDNVETLYLHQNELEIISDTNIMRSLSKLKSDGLVNKLGVSVYSKEECEFALDNSVYDVIQLPISILDSHIYSRLLEGGVEKEIIARSIFLQGTLFNRKNIKTKVRQADDMLEYFSTIDGLVKKYETDLLTLACSFVLALPSVNYVIVGTTGKKNLSKIVKASKAKIQKELHTEVKALSDKYKEWGNPRNWIN